MSTRSIAYAAVAALLLAAPSSRAVDDPALAKELFTQGQREFNLGHWSDALVLLERSYKLKPVPELLYNTAQCHRLMGNLEQARRVYRAFLGSAPRPKEELLEAAREKLAEVEQALEKQAKTKRSEPQSLAAPERAAAIAQGQLDSALMPPPVKASEPRLAVPAPLPAAKRAPAPAAAVSAAPPERLGGQRIAGYSALGAGVLAAGAGAYFGLAAKTAGGQWAAAGTPAAWGAARDDAQGKARVATVSWIAAGVLLAAGTALLMFGQ